MKVCFVASRFPFPITKGDTLRAYHQIKELSREHSVHLVTGAETPPSPEALAEMRRYCASIDVIPLGKLRSIVTTATRGIGSHLPLQVLYFMSPQLRSAVARAAERERFDIIHAMTIRVAPAVFAAPGTPVVVDFMDSFGANVATRRERVGPVARRLYDLELTRVAKYERDVAGRAAGGFVIAELDRDTIGVPELDIIPNGVDMTTVSFHAGERDARTLIFTGNMGYGPNVDAVTWFAADIWPRLRSRRPDLRFLIVGARPAPAVAALGRIDGIEVTGKVESMVPYLHRATIAVCPIRCGSGMQNKVLEAMAAGVPVVTTAFANRSIAARPDRDVRVSDEPEGFADRVLELLDDPAAARRQAAAARLFVEAEFTWSHRSEQLVATYRKAIERFARPAHVVGV